MAIIGSMTRSEFIDKYDVLKRHYDQSIEIGDVLGRVLLDGPAVVDYGGELEAHYIKLLAAQSGISEDAIGWLLYEGGGSCYIEEREQKFNVITAEDLWEFEQEVKKYEQC